MDSTGKVVREWLGIKSLASLSVYVDMQVGTARNKFRATKKNHYFKVSGQRNTSFLIKTVCLGD